MSPDRLPPVPLSQEGQDPHGEQAFKASCSMLGLPYIPPHAKLTLVREKTIEETEVIPGQTIPGEVTTKKTPPGAPRVNSQALLRRFREVVNNNEQLALEEGETREGVLKEPFSPKNIHHWITYATQGPDTQEKDTTVTKTKTEADKQELTKKQKATLFIVSNSNLIDAPFSKEETWGREFASVYMERIMQACYNTAAITYINYNELPQLTLPEYFLQQRPTRILSDRELWDEKTRENRYIYPFIRRNFCAPGNNPGDVHVLHMSNDKENWGVWDFADNMMHFSWVTDATINYYRKKGSNS
jgi:hypothetical protein